jgi:hypothetical protein
MFDSLHLVEQIEHFGDPDDEAAMADAADAADAGKGRSVE